MLFAYNEEKRIEYAIRNFINFGEVLVLDGGSTDATKDITQRLGARFISRPSSGKPQSETQENFDLIRSETQSDWIYWGYVDNIAPYTLVQELVRISQQSVYKRVLVPMHTYLWGKVSYPAQKSLFPAAFHRDYMDFSDNHIHHMGRFTGTPSEIVTLPDKDEFTLRHFSTYAITKFVAGHMRYAEEESLYKFQSGERFSLAKTTLAMVRYCYIFRRGIRLGKVGFVIMLSYAFSRFMVYARLLEREQNITLDTIEDEYSKEKRRILSQNVLR